MEQNSSGGQNKNEGFLKRFQFPLIIAAIALVAIIISVANKDADGDQNTNEQTNEQTNDSSDQNQNPEGDVSNNDDGSAAQAPALVAAGGNVSRAGILRNSDNLSRGNLMVESSSGKIYISTKRDFTQLLDKQVTLQAHGTINSFAFLGFAEHPGSIAGTDTTARGGGDTTAPDQTGDVSFSGQLQDSDNPAKGNYMIVAGNTKVYLKTVHDYSSLTNSSVILTAEGTINNFSKARVSKK